MILNFRFSTLFQDPFLLKGLKISPGTKEKPTIIPTVEETRTIGCVCKWTQLCRPELFLTVYVFNISCNCR